MTSFTRRLLLTAVFLAASALSITAETYLAKCIGVTDGDTITILKDGFPVKIRLEGIDCPEFGQDFGSRAKEFTSGLVFGKQIEVHATGLDKYGRTLARLYVGDTDVSLQLVKAGLAWHYKQYSTDSTLAQAEIEARASKTGLWSIPNPIPPWEFRHGQARTSAPQGEASEQQTPQASEQVYITQSGTKYHREGCRYLQKSAIAVSLSDAVSRGYGPCSVCNPPRLTVSPNQAQSLTQDQQKANPETVYVTRSGGKYHRAGCQYLRKSAIPMTKADAIAKGYTPCSRCNP